MSNVKSNLDTLLTVKNQAKDNSSADLYFYGDIVSDWWGAYTEEDQYPEQIRQFLEETKEVKNLNIYINSGGGSVFAGIAIYNMLKRHKANKIVHVDGVAASIASVIAMAGDKVIMPSNAYLMIHKPWCSITGNSKDMKKMAEDLEIIEQGVLNVYKENLKEGVEWETVKNLVDNETWLTGEQSAKYFNIETIQTNNAMNKIDSDNINNFKNIPNDIKDILNGVKNKKSNTIDKEYEALKAESKIILENLNLK